MILEYDAPATWPAEVINFLDGTVAILDDWHGDQCFATPYEYDDIIRRLYALLEPHDILAWHNTRLTAREADAILANGMFLPSVDALLQRIDAAQAEGAFSSAIADGFKGRHQADSPTRAGRIWFLFTRPHNDTGIEDFLRFWGGESLYAAIDRDPTLGPVLRSVGIPSVVEAAIPIALFPDSLGFESHIARQFSAWRAGHSYDGLPHDRVRVALPRECIRRIVTFPSAEFSELTGCDQYYEPL